MEELRLALEIGDLNVISKIEVECDEKIEREIKKEKVFIDRDYFCERNHVTDDIRGIILCDGERKNKIVAAGRTSGDGNCLYNAVSQLLTGNESRISLDLRMSVSAKLFRKAAYCTLNNIYNEVWHAVVKHMAAKDIHISFYKQLGY